MTEHLMGFTDKDSQNHNETADQKVILWNDTIQEGKMFTGF